MRVLSGVQPTGHIHLGHYLGAMRNWMVLSDDHEVICCVADLDALTALRDPDDLPKQIRDCAAMLLACGMDSPRVTIFRQSQVPEHTGLYWLLASITDFKELYRVAEFEEKGGQSEDLSAGLFVSPVLMAADILLYQTELVPVGEGHRKELELIGNLAERFNARFGPTFQVPHPIIPEEDTQVMALDDPTLRMTKSSPAGFGYIGLDDPPDLIRIKIMQTATETGCEVRRRPDKPALSNLLTIYSRLAGRHITDLEVAYTGRDATEFKEALVEVVVNALTPIQERLEEFRSNPDFIEKVLAEGAVRVRPIAGSTLVQAKARMGL